MNYNLLTDLAIDLGYELAMSGAETFRVEESMTRLLDAYNVDSDVFAVPNYVMVTIRFEPNPEPGKTQFGNSPQNACQYQKVLPQLLSL